jgi:hypothetical protein
MVLDPGLLKKKEDRNSINHMVQLLAQPGGEGVTWHVPLCTLDMLFGERRSNTEGGSRPTVCCTTWPHLQQAAGNVCASGPGCWRSRYVCTD